jgi:hypothetical protein
MRASTWPAASLEVVPAGFEADADGEEEADEVGLEERAGLDGDEEDGDEEDGDDEDGPDEDDDADEEGPPATGCREWARDGVGCTDRGTDGLAVTAPNGWPAHGAAPWAASVAGPTAPASAPDAADPAAPWAAAPWAAVPWGGAQEAGAGRSVRVPDAVGAGPFLLAR